MTRANYSQAISALVTHFGDDLLCVVLFGSQARGEAHMDSDHDLLVVIDNLPLEPIARMKRMVAALEECDLRINPVAATCSEFTRDVTPLILDICYDGVCLYGQDFFEPMRGKVRTGLQSAGLHRHTIENSFFWQFEKEPTGPWEFSWTGFHEFTKRT